MLEKLTNLTLTKEQIELRKRIIDISYENNLSHIGSCLTAVDLISAVYQVKRHEDKFVLSSGHAALALYVVLERQGVINKINMQQLGVHPDRNPTLGIEVSTGSLGQGLPIAVGMSLADRNKDIWCLISDGEAAEGSIWESLRIASEQRLSNLKIIVNVNGYGAYDRINSTNLLGRFSSLGLAVATVSGHDLSQLCHKLSTPTYQTPLLVFAETDVAAIPPLAGIEAHYQVLKPSDYQLAIAILGQIRLAPNSNPTADQQNLFYEI